MNNKNLWPVCVLIYIFLWSVVLSWIQCLWLNQFLIKHFDVCLFSQLLIILLLCYQHRESWGRGKFSVPFVSKIKEMLQSLNSSNLLFAVKLHLYIIFSSVLSLWQLSLTCKGLLGVDVGFGFCCKVGGFGFLAWRKVGRYGGPRCHWRGRIPSHWRGGIPRKHSTPNWLRDEDEEYLEHQT